jgi:gamma-D-glutamyl-L-lysine dipeptidyl-peptidase
MTEQLRSPWYLQSLAALVLLIMTAGSGCAANQAPARTAGSPRVATAPGISRAGFAIQFGAFGEVMNAERLARRLQEKGIEAFYFRKDNGLYAVRFGDYGSKGQAKAAADRLVKERLITGYYIASPREMPRLRPVVPELKKLPEQEWRKPAVTAERREAVREDASRASTTSTDKEMGQIAARTAERFVGIPYRWGGDTVVDGMDCSGFVRAVFNLCGVNIPRTSGEQYKVGQGVAQADLKDGDLVFFGASSEQINHVGIYVGNGKFVHAPRRGDDIKVSALDEAYFIKRFVGARRYF